jgi:Tol biopolymer transport system component
MLNFHKVILTFTLYPCIIISMVSCTKSDSGDNNPVTPIDPSRPILSGRLLFHSYSCYSCNDSRLYLFNFSTQKLTLLSNNWNITNPMNAHFSPDGSKIVFMGLQPKTNNWDVFLYRPGSRTSPENLTPNSIGHDEDPKFSPDGLKIIYKHDGVLKEMDTTGIIIRTITIPQIEASMPYYATNGLDLLYAVNELSGSKLDIYQFTSIDGLTHPLSAIPDVEEYYPITRNDTTFLFTRWVDASNQNDQVYIGFFDGRTSINLPFNNTEDNFSDAFPVNDSIVILSSTKKGGAGQYDLYLADINTGKTWSLALYNDYINTSRSELGACFTDK